MDDLRWTKVHGTDNLPLRWLGNLALAIANPLIKFGADYGTLYSYEADEDEVL
jgi:hypothetical protein